MNNLQTIQQEAIADSHRRSLTDDDIREYLARAYEAGGEATYQRFVEVSGDLEYGKDDICFGCIQTIKARLRPSPTPTEN